MVKHLVYYVAAIALTQVLIYSTQIQCQSEVEIGLEKSEIVKEDESSNEVDNQDKRTNDLVGLTSAQIVRLHGFEANVHVIDTQPGVRINLVHVINPAVKEPTKIPVLFIHGIATSTTCFMVNAEKGRPRDLSQYNAANMSLPELESLLENDRAAASLPFLLSNFGHDVWLMNRRATLESQLTAPISKIKPTDQLKKKTISKHGNIGSQSGHFSSLEESKISGQSNKHQLKKLEDVNREPFGGTNPLGHIRKIIRETISWTLNEQLNDKIVNKRYWDYSMDEQAQFDVPAVMRFILDATHWPRLSIVGHSMGGAIPLMMLSEKPGLARKRKFFSLICLLLTNDANFNI